MNFENLLNEIPTQAWWGFLFFSTFIENVFPPYPGDTVVVFGGYLLGAGKISAISVASSIYLGNITSAALMYYAGDKVLAFFRKYARFSWAKEMLNKHNLHKTEAWFKKYGFVAVLFSRFSAGIRFFVAIVAGMFNMNIVLFLLAFSAATVIWNSLLVYGGYVLGGNWQKVLDMLRVYNIAIVGLIGLGITIFIFIRLKKKKRSSKS